MSDLVQDGLLAWVERGERGLGGEAVELLRQEWRPRVQRWLQSPGEDEVDEVLDEALIALCAFEPGQRPRALAPSEAVSPAAWRRQVLKNHLIDRGRRRGRRDHAERGMAAGLSNAAEAETWRRERQQRAEPHGSNSRYTIGIREVVPEVALVSPEAIELRGMRHDVLRALPTLAVRRRVLLLLALRGDPSPFAADLATELHEPEEEVLARIQTALSAPHDGGHEHLSLAMIRVIWPQEHASKAREAARKNLERAIQDIRLKLELSA